MLKIFLAVKKDILISADLIFRYLDKNIKYGKISHCIFLKFRFKTGKVFFSLQHHFITLK